MKNTHKDAHIVLSEEEIARITERLETIITALPYCAKEYENNKGNALGSIVAEVQKEVLSQVQTQIATINDSFNPDLKEAKPVAWNLYPLHKRTNSPLHLDQTSKALNATISPSSERQDLFSPELRLSKSYAYSHSTQQQLFNGFLKPASVIWYHIENEMLHAMILTPEELSSIQKYVEATPYLTWISTTEDNVLCGTRPNKILDNERYQELYTKYVFLTERLIRC